jgi:carboxyl-terminal processing protease
VAISKYSNGETHFLRTLSSRPFYSGPLILLISKLSASAAEIVAQALKDYGVALIVGDERSFGKGSIQLQTVTDAHAELFFKITVGKYYSVSGITPQMLGVIADIVVPTDFSPFLIGERYLPFALKADRMPPMFDDKLADLDGKNLLWFQKNYLPYLQSFTPKWREMIPDLQRKSQQRAPSFALPKDDNLMLFDVYGKHKDVDPILIEATSILKDMVLLKEKIESVQPFEHKEVLQEN